MNRTGLTVVVAIVVFAVATGIFSSVTKNEFVWDDPIVFKRQLPYFDSFENVFFPPGSIPQFGVHYYRPLIVVTYQIDEWVAKTFWELEQRDEARRLVYHTSVVLYHGIASALCFIFGVWLARAARTPWPFDALVSGCGALLFAVHPIHVESVAWMAGRSDVVCAIFFLTALLLYGRLRERGHWVYAVLFGLAAFGAMLCKESGVALILVVPLIELILPVPARAGSATEQLVSRAERRRRERDNRKRAVKTGPPLRLARWLAWIMLVAAVIGYLALRSGALNASLIKTRMQAGASTLQQIPGALLGSVGWYLRKTIYPPPQSAFVTQLPGIATIVLGGVVVVAVSAWLVLHLKRRGRGTVELFCVTFFLATLAPSLAIAVKAISETPLAERYLYIPSVGACLILPLLIFRSAELIPAGAAVRAALATLVCVAIAVPAARTTLTRSRVWKSDLVFWTDTVSKSPNDGLPHLHLGIAYSDLNQIDLALEQYEQAYQKYDDSEGRSIALNNLGSLYMQQKRWFEAIDTFQKALQERREYPTPHYNSALAQYNLALEADDPAEQDDRIRKAISHYEQALAMNPRYTKAHLRYGALLIQLGQVDRGRRHLEEVIRLDPSSAEAREARGRLERQSP